MTDTKPRDLTPEELALSQSPSGSGKDSAPMRIPPGTESPIELLNPVAADASPVAGPSQTGHSNK